MEDNLFEFAKQVKDREDFLLFMSGLIDEYELNHEDWENFDLKRYLEAIRACLSDLTEEDISWARLSEIFLAARVYE